MKRVSSSVRFYFNSPGTCSSAGKTLPEKPFSKRKLAQAHGTAVKKASTNQSEQARGQARGHAFEVCIHSVGGQS